MSQPESNDVMDGIEQLEKEMAKAASFKKAAEAISMAKARLVMGKITTAKKTDAEKLADKPKTAFFASVAMRLSYAPEEGIETAATDGKRIIYEPEFINGLNDNQRIFLLAHEVMHVTNAHHARMGNRDLEQWNIACDLAINPILINCGLEPIEGCLIPGQGTYADLQPGLSAEEYYREVQKNPPPKGSGKDPGGCGGIIPPGDGSPAAIEKALNDARLMAAAARDAGRRAGKLPGDMDRSVTDVLESRVDYRAVLRRFLARYAKNDFSWQQPNRRFIHQGLYLPGMRSEELGKIVIHIDDSGSITQEDMNQFSGEIESIMGSYDIEQVIILYCDCAVHKVQTWNPGEGQLKLEGSENGGGGTSHKPVWEYIETHGIQPSCLISLTDLETNFGDAPDYPVLFCVKGHQRNAPFGEVIGID